MSKFHLILTKPLMRRRKIWIYSSTEVADNFVPNPKEDARMESEEMEVGQQIWIFHDGETDRWNCMANVNPYAHVVVFVGSRQEKDRQGETRIVHEVVHVSKSWKCCTLMKAEICREDVIKVRQNSCSRVIGPSSF